MPCHCEGLIKAIDAYLAKEDDELELALEAAGYVDAPETIEHITSLEDGIAVVLISETDYILDSLKDRIDLKEYFSEVWPAIKKNNPTADKLFNLFWEDFSGYMKPLASKYIAATDAELTVQAVSQRTTAWTKQWSKDLSELMQLESHTQVEKILTTAMDEGQSVAEVTQALMDSGIRNEYVRARKTALTETLRAHSVANQEAMMQSPAVVEKEWRHSGAYRNEPRINHVAMQGQRVSKEAAYVLQGADGGVYYPLYPRDPSLPAGESINCHCISQPIVSEEILGLPIEERRLLQEEALAAMDDAWEEELYLKNKALAGL
ncbi:phage minor head protein [Acutalibacter muris]|uniref:phage minor head protein n=1 Tax=Acutalibacter muris TaxID=1796620 RepID=UPI00272A7997|nr:phage minor head protein [Acutalibacter muris]